MHRLASLLLLAVVCAGHALGTNRVLDPLQQPDTAPVDEEAPPTLLPTPAFAPHHQVAPMRLGGADAPLGQSEEGRLPISDAMRQQLPPPGLYGPG